MSFQIRGCKQYYGGYNLPPLVGIGLTELLNSGGAKAPPAHTWANDSSELVFEFYKFVYNFH